MKQKHYITRNKIRLLGDGVKERSSIMWWPLQYRRVQFKNIFKCHRTSNIILTIVVLVNLTSQNLASYPKTSKKYASLKADHQIQRRALEAGCSFPTEWHGTWFHLGFPKPLNISNHFIDSKGTCKESNGPRFIVGER